MTPDGGPRRVEDAARDRRAPARVLHYMRRRLLAALATSAVVVLLAGVARADDRCDARVAEMRRRIDDFPARVVVPESAPQWLRSVASDLETEKRERPVDRERARAALAAWAWPQALGACRDTFTKVVEGQTTRGIGYWSDDLVRALQAGVLACRCEGVDVDALELLMLVILQRPVEQPKAPPPREWDVFPVFTLALGVSYRLNPEVRELTPAFDTTVGARVSAPTQAFRLWLQLAAGYAYAPYSFERTHFFQAGGGPIVGSSTVAFGWLPRFLIGTSGGKVSAGMRNTLVACFQDCLGLVELSYDRLWLTGPQRDDVRLAFVLDLGPIFMLASRGELQE